MCQVCLFRFMKMSKENRIASLLLRVRGFLDVSTDYLLGKTYKRRIPREERFGAFSKRLKHVRELKGISQRQAAEDLNISPQNLSYYVKRS